MAHTYRPGNGHGHGHRQLVTTSPTHPNAASRFSANPPSPQPRTTFLCDPHRHRDPPALTLTLRLARYSCWATSPPAASTLRRPSMPRRSGSSSRRCSGVERSSYPGMYRSSEVSPRLGRMHPSLCIGNTPPLGRKGGESPLTQVPGLTVARGFLRMHSAGYAGAGSTTHLARN